MARALIRSAFEGSHLGVRGPCHGAYRIARVRQGARTAPRSAKRPSGAGGKSASTRSSVRVPGVSHTQSICPYCGAVLDAELIERGGRVILRRECPEHGLIEALAYGDAERWRDAQRYDRPGAAPLLRQTASRGAARSDCGICPEHAQHTCLGIIEVNTGVQPRLPGLLRRVGHRASGRRLLAVARAGGVDARRVRRRGGRARGGPALGRRAVDPPRRSSTCSPPRRRAGSRW